MTTAPDDASYHSSDLAVAETPARSFLRTPLLGGDGEHHHHDGAMRHRGASNVSFSSRDIEQQQQQPPPRTPSSSRGRARRRILDRSGNFRQSRGRWGVDRLNSRGDGMNRRWWCCCRGIYREWGKDWFFWLAYQKTWFLFLLLFVSYGLIIVFFGFIYLVSAEGVRVCKLHRTLLKWVIFFFFIRACPYLGAKRK